MEIGWMDCPKCGCCALEGEYWDDDSVVCTNCGFAEFYWDSIDLGNGDEWILLMWKDEEEKDDVDRAKSKVCI